MSFLRLFLSLAVSVGVAAASPRVALIVETREDSVSTPAADWQAALTASLASAAPAVALVERAELARLWTEREQLALAAAPDSAHASAAATTPSPLNVDAYVHFRQIAAARWIVTHLDAATGRELGSFVVEAADLSASPALAAAAARLLAAPTPATPAASAPRVAVVESADAAGDAGDAPLFGLAAHLRDALAEAGLIVLDRALTQELAVEQHDAARGLRATVAPAGLLGVDHWIELSPREARLVRARDGIALGSRPRRDDTTSSREVASLRRWTLDLLKRQTEVSTADTYLPQIETEALEPFYRGLGLYDAGRPIEAINEFTRAYLANDRFVQAYEWEARCYDALDMPELAAATRRFLQIGQVENLIAGSARTQPDDAVAFLGVIAAHESGLDALAPSLSAWTASALAARSDLELRLPDQLTRLRREYDWMSGAGSFAGARWEQAPTLFSRVALSARLEKHAGGLRLVWLRRDLVSGRLAADKTLDLATDPARWPRQISRFVRDWDASPSDTPLPAPTKTTASSEPKKLAAALARASGLEINSARLRLALAEPDNKLLQGRRFEKGRLHVIESYADLLEYALRDWRIARLPADSPTRRWLELERACEHLGPHSLGESRRGAPLDGVAELARLAEPPRRDAPGILARYFQLYAQQAEPPPDRLAAACAELLAELALIDPTTMPEHKLLVRHVTSLSRLARLAAGHTDETDAFVFNNTLQEPRPLRLEWQRDGNPLLRAENYLVTLRYLDRQTPAERVTAARLALAANGRPAPHVDPRWLAEFPDALELSDPISQMLFELDRADGLPISHPLEPDKQTGYLRAVVDHMPGLLERWLARAQDEDMLRHLDTVAGNFFHHLQGHTLSELVSDTDYEAMRERVVAAFDSAVGRVGGTRGSGWSKVVDWRELTRPLARERRKDFLRYAGRWIMRPEALEREFTEADRKLAAASPENAEKADLPAWWKKLREWQFEYAFTAPETAAHYARRTTEALRHLRAQPRLSLADAQMFFEHALWLHYGRREIDAEPLYQALLALPAGSFGTPAEQTEMQANAAFRLAQITHLAGRRPEAIALASRALELCGTASPRLIAERFTNKWNDHELSTVCARLLRELRLEPALLALPPRTRVVSVPTPNGDNPHLHVFYHTPPAIESGPEPARRVLVLAPTNNQDALAYLEPSSEWTRFADTHNLVLVVPRFHASETPMRADHRFTHARYAQVWSGPALLAALAKISRATPLTPNRLLLHGQTSGGGFAASFAAWRPDLVAAVSVVNGNWSMPRTALPGLRPRAEWRTVKFHISAGALNNFRGDGGLPRYDTALDFVTRLIGDGVPVEWRSWPDVYHQPTPEMETAARDFLARQLVP